VCKTALPEHTKDHTKRLEQSSKVKHRSQSWFSQKTLQSQFVFHLFVRWGFLHTHPL